MIKSINDIIMIASFPKENYDKNILDKLSNEKLRELVEKDKNCDIWDIYEFEDNINNNNIDIENNWIKLIN